MLVHVTNTFRERARISLGQVTEQGCSCQLASAPSSTPTACFLPGSLASDIPTLLECLLGSPPLHMGTFQVDVRRWQGPLTARTLGQYTPSLSGPLLLGWVLEGPGHCSVSSWTTCSSTCIWLASYFRFSLPEGAQSCSVRPETPNLTPAQPLGSSHLNPSSCSLQVDPSLRTDG